MGPIIGLTNGLGAVNGALLAVGRWLGATAMALMVIVILLQVFCRYALGSALAWPEEASRFLMLWSTGLMAPSALRRGGFVAIDMLVRLMPAILAALAALFFLALTLIVLWFGLTIAWSEVTGIGGRFESDSLWIPLSLDGSNWMKAPKSWMMTSMLVGMALMFVVAIELFLRSLISMFGAADRLAEIPETITLGAE